MWIVRIALNRPYTFVVLAILILFVGPLDDLTHADRHLSQHQHSGRHRGLELRRPVRRRDGAAHRQRLRARHDHDGQRHRAHRVADRCAARRSSRCSSSPARRSKRRSRRSPRSRRSALRNMPPGHDLAVHHHLQRLDAFRSCSSALSGNGLSEQQLYDLGVNFIRVQLATVQGASIPNPYGGKQAQIQVDLDPRALQAKGLSPTDVVNAISASEPDPARRHVEDRRLRVRRAAERQPGHGRGAERPADQDGERLADLHPRRRATCATASRRRPTSSGSNGQRAALLSVIKIGRRLDARHHRSRSRRRCRGSRRACRRSSRSSRWPTSRCSSAPRSTGWCARRSSPPA